MFHKKGVLQLWSKSLKNTFKRVISQYKITDCKSLSCICNRLFLGANDGKNSSNDFFGHGWILDQSELITQCLSAKLKETA